MSGELHPSLPLVLGAVLALLVPRAARLASVLAPAAAIGLLLACASGTELNVALFGGTVHLLRIDALARVFALAFALFSLIANVYAWKIAPARELAVGLLLAGAAVAVVMAGDLLSLFVAWEWLSLSSVVLIWLGRTAAAQRAGMRYLLLHIVGGACLLGGIIMQPSAGGFSLLGPISLSSTGGALILVGFAVNAAVPPLHAWLPDAYPRASIAGSVWLTAFTTKSAVYALARCFAGQELLVWLGVAMAIYGVVFALMENDVRRLLSYHIVSQVGFMVVGVGLGTALALDGSTAHAFCHIFYKGLLMMCAGAIIHATGRGRLADLGALGRKLPWVLAYFTVGAFAISGVPLLSGFVSKSMTIAAAASDGRAIVALGLEVASVGTFLSISGKLLYRTFLVPTGPTVLSPIPVSMSLAMALSSLICVGLGVVPGVLYRLLPHAVSYRPYTLAHLVEALELLVVAAVGFWVLRQRLVSERTVTRDLDRLYVGVARAGVWLATTPLVQLGCCAMRVEAWLAGAFVRFAGRVRRRGTDASIAVQVGLLVFVTVVMVLLVVR